LRVGVSGQFGHHSRGRGEEGENMRTLIHSGVIVLACLLSACGHRDEMRPKDVSQELAQAFNKGDASACTGFYTDDAAILPQAASTLIGRAAILKLFQGRITPNMQYTVSSTVSGFDGDLAFDQGTYVLRNIEQGRDVEFGKYVNVFRKIKGKWKIFRTIWNMDSPGALSSQPQAPVESKAPPASPGHPG